MARPPTGSVIERSGKRGTTYALRFRAYGRRRYLTTEAVSRAEAELELANVLADVRRGIWRPPATTPIEPEQATDPGFHVFASEWLAARRAEGLAERTIEDYQWALTHHLLPFFRDHALAEITVREVDRYKTTKASEGVLGAAQVNKTLTRLSQILETAVEYDLIPANPARGRRRRLKTSRPVRPFVQPEQLPSLLKASEGLLGGRGRPLLATLVGAGGLRISEALALEWRDFDRARGTLRIGRSKTEAGVRVVDLTPAVREEIGDWKDTTRHGRPVDLIFPTSTGRPDNRNNVRRRLLVKAIEKANKRLAELGIEPIGKVSPHGLRRTYATIRCAAGDDPVYVAAQLGHVSPTFTLSVYAQATKHRDRLVGAERIEYRKALEWAQMGTSGVGELGVIAGTDNAEKVKAA